jgi:tetratricopeptide (TPR) repeat protein/tRNA A-37 threonylcarbamoyl transferase component Bud32
MNRVDPKKASQTVVPEQPETPIANLWQRWRQDQCPDFSDPAEGGPSADQVLALLRFDQCQRWREGVRVPAERYLATYSVLKTDPEQAFVMVYGEFLLRQQLGEAPTLEEYVSRFPQFAERLREQDEFHRAMAPGSWADAGAPPQPGPLPEQAGVCRILGEVARGGMGVILRGHDEQLGRDLAVKVLSDAYKDQPEVVQRFLEEARVSGQLQHPGVVPVHEVGRFADGRPYFTMKLVQGRTLAELLGRRQEGEPGASAPEGRSPASFPGADAPGAAKDLPRLLKVFEQVCQTVAYAHARRVVHRDLKPANIMVGAFGEVQVMDWGLAKVLEAPSRGAEPAQGATEGPVRPVAPGQAGAESLAGAAIGTPAYMAPEQARGEGSRLDERCDVFGLGAILCEILTGKPPYSSGLLAVVLQQAQAGDLTGALGRLDACGADAELLQLAKACLAPAPQDRPRDAGVVAERVTAYLAGVQERLRRAEVERAAAQARATAEAAEAAAERRARRLTVGLAAAVLVLSLAVGGGWMWFKGQREARAAAFRAGMDQADRLLADSQWGPARTAVVALPEPADEESQRRGREFLSDLDMLERVTEVWASTPDRFGPDDTAAEYAQAFREYGIDVDALGPEEAAKRIRARPDVVVRELVGAVIDWSWTHWRKGRKDTPESRRLAALARAVDPDPWRNQLRDLQDRRDFPALRRLAEGPDTLTQAPRSLLLLGRFLAEEDRPAAVSFLWKVQRRYPSDPWINRDLAGDLERLQPPRYDEALAFYRAAAAVRPVLILQVAKTLALKGEVDEAIVLNQELTRARPHYVQAFGNLGVALGMKRRWAEALAALDEAIRLRPDYVKPYVERGHVLREMGRQDEAIASWKEALRRQDETIRLRPDDVTAHYERGLILKELGRLDETIAAFQEAVRLKPDNAMSHAYLSETFLRNGRTDKALAAAQKALELDPKLAAGHFYLGNALLKMGQVEAAIDAFQEAATLDTKRAPIYFQLGTALLNRGRLDDALAALQKAIVLDPKYVSAYVNISNILYTQRRLDEAAAVLQKTLALDPKCVPALVNWGLVLSDTDRRDEALVVLQKAAAVDPKSFNPHKALGEVLIELGRFSEASAAFRRCLELLPSDAPLHQEVAQRLAQCEQWVALDRRLPALLRGEAQPKDTDERLQLAKLCLQPGKRLYAAAARFCQEALAAEPKLAEDLKAGHRYDAACAATQAGCDKGKDEPPPDEPTRARWRKQALDWLRADLALWAKLALNDPKAHARVRQTLQHWQSDSDLVGIRDAAALARLPADERQTCQKLWADVEALIHKAQGKAK